jgi:arylsulfatase A-like enzyme
MVASSTPTGLYESMLIIVTSDHGESLGDHGVFDGHGLFWENGLRVPLLVKLPRGHGQHQDWRGQRHKWRVQSVDIAPTILSVTGIGIPPSFQGLSLVEPGDRVVLAQRLPLGKLPVRSMIDGQYKLTGGWDWSLYDLKNDPAEEHSLHAERPRLLRDMRAELKALSARMQRTNKQLSDPQADDSITLDEGSRQRLKELGYLGE